MNGAGERQPYMSRAANPVTSAMPTFCTRVSASMAPGSVSDFAARAQIQE